MSGTTEVDHASGTERKREASRAGRAGKIAGSRRRARNPDAAELTRAGVPELVALVEGGHVDCAGAALVSRLPPAEQRALVAEGRGAIRRRVGQIRRAAGWQPLAGAARPLVLALLEVVDEVFAVLREGDDLAQLAALEGRARVLVDELGPLLGQGVQHG